MKSISKYVILAIGLILVAIGIIIIKNNDKTIYYSGLYTKDGIKINIFRKDDKLYYTVKKDIYGILNLDEENNKASGERFSYKYSYSFETDGLDIESDDNSIPSGHYKREKDITFEEYYESAFGEKKYFDSEFNGIYKNDLGTIYIYQISESYCNVIIDHKNGFKKGYFNISDEFNYNINSTEGDAIFTISVMEDKAVVETTLIRVDREMQYDGEYTKVSSLKMEDLITNRLLYLF